MNQFTVDASLCRKDGICAKVCPIQIIDAKDRIAEDTSIDSFISGFELAWQLSMELNNYKNERLASCRTGRLGARFVSQKEHHKEETT